MNHPILDTTGTIAEDNALVIGELVDSEAPIKPEFIPESDERSDWGFGLFTINHDGVWLFDLDNTHPDVQGLAVGQTLTDSYEFSYIDENGDRLTDSVVVTITGTNDAPVAHASTAYMNEPEEFGEDARTDGKVHATDVDNGAEIKFYDTSLPQYGTISMAEDGTWEYVVDSSNEVVHALNEGDTLNETINFVAIDEHGAESASTLTIVIHGTNDFPVIEEETYVTIAEPGSESDITSASGQVEATDLDSNAQIKFYDTTQPQYGTITMAEDGSWTYVVDSTNGEVQGLAIGDEIIDFVDFVAIDEHGAETSSSINITITGTNDAPVATPGYESLYEGDALVIGELEAYDVDAGAVLEYTPVSDVLSNTGYGNFTVNSDGIWLYDLHSDHPEVDALADGEVLEDTFEYTVTDEHGATSTGILTVQINGTNDAPVAVAGEGSIAEGTALVIGELEAIDVDHGAELSYTPVSDVTSETGYGNFTVNHDGVWLYDLHSDHPAVAALGAGDTLVDSFEYTVADEHGAEAVGTISVTITGTNDEPVTEGGATSIASSEAPSEAPSDILDALGSDADLNVNTNGGDSVNLDAPTGVAAAPPVIVEPVAVAAPAIPALGEDEAAAAAASAI